MKRNRGFLKIVMKTILKAQKITIAHRSNIEMMKIQIFFLRKITLKRWKIFPLLNEKNSKT